MEKWKYSLMAFAVVALTACGGGGDDDDSPAPAPSPTPTPSPAPGSNILDVTQVDGRRFTKSSAATGIKTVVAQQAVSAPTIELGALPEADTYVDYGPGKAVRVAAAREVTQTQTAAATRSALAWSRNATGQYVGSIGFQADGAYGLRVGLRVASLPDGAVVQVATATSDTVVFETSGADINAALARNVAAGETGAAAQTWWTPKLSGDRVVVSIALPLGADPAALDVSIPQVSHVFADVDALAMQEASSAKDVGDSEACELDVTCYTNGQNERDAVARMLYQKGGDGYYCTGTLLNDAVKSSKPYFITANHCISTQASASSLQTDWFFRTSSCNNGRLSASSASRYKGATLLWSQTINDMTLLRLNEDPPSGVWLAGWDASTQSLQAVYDIHQPMGDLAKISGGSMASYAVCDLNAQCSNTNTSSAPFYQVKWSDGTTEGGSSGSGLLKLSSGQLIGTLYAGSASCSNQGGSDYFGRLDWGFNNGINRWLAAADPSKL
ncbi:hypothetical protein CCO03_03295 [Comamonas serinivorans]|uniref:Peptidase S1 domain-containing protein n=1 Tax=Comamonas serinivorans TaxID=1082851 RepID=A0A1Y0EK76_9BURK|nr:trypsin-like peptidase domain-containing protein [Comamonas serinivorans]ARU03838.1 hypothetical protein CCO03_03295 [Comamonas serinivorans]